MAIFLTQQPMFFHSITGKSMPMCTSITQQGGQSHLIKAERNFSGSLKKCPGQRAISGTHHRGGQASESVHTLQCSYPDSLEHNRKGRG